MLKINLFYILILSILSSCALSSKKEHKKLIGVGLISDIPFLDNKTKQVYIMIDTVMLYYLDDIVLFRETYTFTEYNQNAIKDGTTILSDDPNTIRYRTKKFLNYLYRENENSGLRYDSIMVKDHKIFNVDSLLRKKTFKSAKFYDITNDVLVESKRDKKKVLYLKNIYQKLNMMRVIMTLLISSLILNLNLYRIPFQT